MLRRFFLVALFISGLAMPAFAATIERHNDLFMDCFVRLDGVIEKGDADRLTSVLHQIFGTSGDQLNPLYDAEAFHGKRLCLDSPGGNFAEAMRIVDVISGKIGTAVAVGLIV